ncbi:hypothetical protein E4P39_12960 [Blastococcus sp. CT_GayMR19]|uniref:ATP-binding protein n=1 Tax=Blastococcus sp. CT_GayMR19 TaxID=2559608 RepID=UPI0010743D55|nr:ATP-binding protein [Blastococcus sp. CT_GayMR19]TFV74394.1 hypothetical protein E4P39_12960 [Blastococcus sp. CT_GayMR19]
MSEDVLDITPDPKVLIALTHTPLKPLDALCELIDNGIDSYRAAAIQGLPVAHPLIDILVPGAGEARRGEGALRLWDNGAGLDREGLRNALKAGFSGKNRYDNLGLFGMGFNIATGKLGRRTTVITARKSDERALRVVIDLPTVVNNRKFEVPVETIDKPANFSHGTIVSIDHWWPEGDPNAGFIVQLASIAKPRLREQIGRRYASILRSDDEGRIRILVNSDPVVGFEHCVWASERFVERQSWGRIPARIDFDEVIHSQRRCVYDGTAADDNADECLACGRNEFRTLEERVRGWVGIQRFDDNNQFGIDLIRNGRAIRVGEKDAFFNHPDDLGGAVKEYPTDQQTGRIVGEVNLDHVPVDFQKQDFQRSGEEWHRALDYLRGGSLLPSNWNAGEKNSTPVSKLFQGYRKVRNYGRQDMYMGRFDETQQKAVRIAREVEKDYYERFLKREPGYYDDARWWELVEEANVRPVMALEECPDCGFQNRSGVEVCEDCGRILLGKTCANCGTEIVASATSCSDCGSSQVPEVVEPWRCLVCSAVNDVEDEHCRGCGSVRGAENPVTREVLFRDAEKLPELSLDNKTFTLSDGRRTEPIDVSVYRTGPLRPVWNGQPVPTISYRSPGSIEVFVDTDHALYSQMGIHPQESVAIEVAQYLYVLHPDLQGQPGHSVNSIACIVLADRWGDELTIRQDQLKEEISGTFDRIRDRLAGNVDGDDFFDTLDQFEQRDLADRLINERLLERLSDMRPSGEYLRYVAPGVLARFFAHAPEAWFGLVWTDHLPDELVVGAPAAESARQHLVGAYRRCLEDCAEYLRFPDEEPTGVARARAASDYLEAHLT